MSKTTEKQLLKARTSLFVKKVNKSEIVSRFYYIETVAVLMLGMWFCIFGR